MASFTLEEIEKASGAKVLHKGAKGFVDGISTDTRTIGRENYSSPFQVKISTVMPF